MSTPHLKRENTVGCSETNCRHGKYTCKKSERTA